MFQVGISPVALAVSPCFASGVYHENYQVLLIYRLKEGNSTKWLFSSSLTVCLESPITLERNTATGLVIASPVLELTDF